MLKSQRMPSSDTSRTTTTKQTHRSTSCRAKELKIIQQQVGHSHAATTAIYMGVSNEYCNKLLEAAMKNRLGNDWDVMA
ncbi:hypothetical protein ABCR94_37750 [Streptomyces sp. 21So2-11]|uniref:hypothetical protein n=1 Tax=Streptomyces sp. 21So2-11 TaxID=3144408 RepID=UPI00321928AE